MGFDESFGGNPLNRSFFYTTSSAGLEFGKTVLCSNGSCYEHIGIEGYLYPLCSPEPSCIPEDAVRLYRLYHPGRDDYALFPESELAYYLNEGYISQPGLSDWIGYVYPNVDSDGDGVIDGFEGLLGTDPQGTDSDGDGLSDALEILEYPYSDPLIGNTGEQVIGEVGSVTVKHVAKTVTLTRTYNNPVVIAQPPSFEGGETAIVRITDVLADSFTLYIHEAPNKDGLHMNETVSYVVLEAGSWTLPDGTPLEVGRVDTSATVGSRVANQWTPVSFAPMSTVPIVLTQVQTNHDSHWVKTRQRNATSSSFEVALEEEEAATTQHGTETIGWIAIEPSEGNWSGRPYEVANTPDAVKENFYPVTFGIGLGSGPPRFVASMAGYDGPNNAGLRYRNLTAMGVEIKVEEDTTWDAEVFHPDEVVGYLLLGGDGQLLAQPR